MKFLHPGSSATTRLILTRAKSEMLYPAGEMPNCIFSQEKCYLAGFTRARLLGFCSSRGAASRLFVFMAIFSSAAALAGQGSLLSAVDPLIGTANDVNTYPGATLPFGIIQWSPD